MKRGPQIATLALLVSLAAPTSAATFGDSDFTNVATDWSIAVVSSDQGNGTLIDVTSTTLAEQVGELNAEMVIGDHSDPDGGRFLATVIMYEATTYTPSVEGAITGVDFGAGASSDDSANPFMRPVLRQGGNYYVNSTEFRNNTANLSGLTATDWDLYLDLTTDGTTFAVDGASNPDFSATGGEIAFGVIMNGASSTADAATFTIDNDLDDFSVTVSGDPVSGPTFEATTADLDTPGNWTLHEIVARNPGGDCTFSASGASSPNPGRIQVNWTVDHVTQGRRGEVGLVLNSAVWDPAADGALEFVDMSAGQQYVTASPKSRFLIVQGGTFYITGTDFYQTSRTSTGLRAGDFAEVDRTSTGTTGPLTVAGSHPDFSSSGAPLQFGLWSFQASSGAAGPASNGVALDYGSFSVDETLAGPYLDPFGTSENIEPQSDPKPAPAAGLPNILVILCDDLGYGDTALTGHPHIETPNIDNLRSQGAFCPNYYSAANICSPSRAATLTGRMPYRLGIYSFIRDAEDYVHLTHDEVTLPQVLGKVGYECANIGKWHVSHLDAIAPEQLPAMSHYGWDYWLSSDDNSKINNKTGWWRNENRIGTINGYAAEVVSDEIIDWLNNTRDTARPFLLFATYYEPHHDSEAPQAYKDKYAAPPFNQATGPARYYGCVDHMDHQIGRVLGELDTLGLANDTLVVFTSDHGPNPTQNSQYGTAAPYRGTKYQVWDGSTHVPTIIRWPGTVAAGSTISEPLGNIDLLQTIAAITGAEEHLPDDRPLDGSDFSPLLTGTGTFTRGTPLQWHYYKSSASLLAAGSPQAALRSGDLVIAGWYDSPVSFPNVRWMPHPSQNGGVNDMEYLTATGAYTDKTLSLTNGTFRLYDLSTDPHQDTDIYDPGNPAHTALRDQLIASHQALQGAAPGWGFGPWDKSQSSFNDWRSHHWSAPDDTNKAISGPEANPDGDPWPNFLESSLSLDPTVSERTGGARGPRYSLETYDLGTGPQAFQTYTFTVPEDAGAGYQLGYSSDLESWSFQPDGSVLAGRVRNADDTWTVTFRDKEPADGHPRRFMRLRVEEPSS